MKKEQLEELLSQLTTDEKLGMIHGNELFATKGVERLGIPPFAVRNIMSCARAYKVEELEEAERDFVDAEEAVKTGRLQDTLSVELLIVKYSSGR